jgi:enoyl-CoA hydratase/carnithine racemase
MVHQAGQIQTSNPNPLPTAREGQMSAARSQSDARDSYKTRLLPNSLVVSQRGSVTLLRLSRPAKRNALDEATIAGIESFFSDPPHPTRAIIVYGEGKLFSAGADLSAFVEDYALARVRYSRAWHRAFDCVENSCLPVIAVLHGAVVGGGLELAAAAHIRVAERGAYYALPGRTYSAAEGVSLGFSQYVVDDGEGLTKAIELAERIATNTTLSNFAITQALPRIARSGPDGGFLTEGLMASITLDDGEARARINAFLEKRGPKAAHPKPTIE